MKDEEFSLQRRVTSHMVAESWKNIPHVSYLYEPDITDFYREYEALAQSRGAAGHRISLNTILLKVIVEGVKAAPGLNARISYNHRKGEGSLRQSGIINITIPWLLPDGRMITPVVQQVDTMTLNELSAGIMQLGERVAATNIDELLYRAVVRDTLQELRKFHLNVFRRIVAAKISFHGIWGLSGREKARYYETPEKDRLTERDLTCGTITVSNIGSLYKEQKGCFALLEIIPPQIFAVGLGAVLEKPGVYVNEQGEKAIGIRKALPMCLVFDHRAVDFNELVPFLKKLDAIFADPSVIRTW